MKENTLYPWALYSATNLYPTDAPQFATDSPVSMLDQPLLIAESWDTIYSNGISDLSVVMNSDVVNLICAGGGGPYFHLQANTSTRFGDPDVYQEFFDYFVAAPDVLASDWPTQKAYLDSLSGVASSGGGGRRIIARTY